MSLEKASKQKADKRVLYVGGLEESVTDKLVHAAFVPFGEIQQIDVPMDQATQKHRGFCFLTFEVEEDAAEAMYNMNNSELLGRVLKVNIAKPMSVKQGSNKPVWAEADEWAEQLQETAQAVDDKAAEVAKPVETILPSGGSTNRYTSAHALHILVDGEAMCKEIKGEIDAGADFSAKAKEHSKCPSSQKGGDLGKFKRGQMVQEFDEVRVATAQALQRCTALAHTLLRVCLPYRGLLETRPLTFFGFSAQVVFGGRPGVLYGPVKTQFGWHLIVVKSLS